MNTVSKMINKNEILVVTFGIQDNSNFSVTCKGGKKLKAADEDEDYFYFNGDRYSYSYGGSDHKTILKYFPELQDIIDLHLVNLEGRSMANCLYHLKNSFNKTKIDDPKYLIEFCKYYKIDPAFISELKEIKNINQLAIFLVENKIFDNWKNEINQVIKKYNLK